MMSICGKYMYTSKSSFWVGLKPIIKIPPSEARKYQAERRAAAARSAVASKSGLFGGFSNGWILNLGIYNETELFWIKNGTP